MKGVWMILFKTGGEWNCLSIMYATQPSFGSKWSVLSLCVCVSAGGVESPKMKGETDIRIFVALFPYDPATMSPNPDAAEEELPFSEGQIIKVSNHTS